MGKASLKSEMSLSSLQRRTWIIIYQKLGILINFHCAGCSTHYSKTKTLLFSKTKGSQTLRPRIRSVKSIWAGIFPLGFPEMEKRFSCLCTAASMEKHEGISRSVHCIMQSILVLREAGRKGKNWKLILKPPSIPRFFARNMRNKGERERQDLKLRCGWEQAKQVIQTFGIG